MPILPSPTQRLFVAAFLMDFYVAMISLAVQNLGIHVLSAPNVVLGLLATFSALSYTLGCLLSGGISDRYGRRRTAVAGCLGAGVAWLLIPNVGSWQHVLWVVPLSGGSISFFWPSLQAWLAELTAGGRRALNRAMGWFNVLWCIGLMLGPVATGYLWGMDYRLCFYLPAAMLTPLILLLLLTPRGVTRPAQSPGSAEVAVEARAPPAPENLAYLRMAWLGNFASWFIWGTILGVFPKLGHVLGFETPAIGWLLFVYRLGQVMMFLCTSYEERWHYRLRPLLAAQFAAVAGVGLAAVASSKLAFAAGFAAAGLCAGVTYAASLFYSLDGRTEGRGRTSGIHEAVLGSGVFLGPLVGGVVAQCVSLRAPFAVAALLMLAASLMQLSVWRRHRRLVAAGGPGGGTEQACA